jgi:hypothetical protein
MIVEVAGACGLRLAISVRFREPPRATPTHYQGEMLAACTVAVAASQALGAPNDAAAQKLRDEAVYADYLATDFEAAAAKLEQALELCKGSAACTPALRARVACDLGVIDFALKRPDEGRERFAAALRDDPHVTLSRDLSTAELEGELGAVRTKAAARTAPKASQDAPASTDCPPQFPGCHSGAAQTTACVSDDECDDRQSCVDGVCRASDRERPSAPYKKNWLSVAFQEDALFLPSAGDACAGGSGYACFGSDGSYYGALPLAGADDQVNGGLTLATMRVLFGYDRALGENVTVGGRLGFALGGGPQRPGAGGFLPLHAEARVAYWLGDDPLARSGFRFFAVAAGGAAQIDASVPVDVYASRQAYIGGQPQSFLAWRKTGLGFAALGGGTMLAFTPSTGIALEARAMEMFPTAATGFGLQMAYLVGL